MAHVLPFPPALAQASLTVNDIRAATPVLGTGQWKDMAEAQMWLLGRGGTLAMVGPYTDMADAAQGFPCYSHPHPQNLNWLWVLTLARTTGARVYGHFVGAGATTLGTFVLDTTVPVHTPQHFLFTETFASITTPYGFTPVVVVDSTSHACMMVGLHCYELPAYDVTTFGSATTEAVDPATCATNAPIYEPTGASVNKSANGLGRVLYSTTTGAGLIGEARRPNLYTWSNHAGVSTTATVATDLGMHESAPSIVARHMYTGTNTSTARVRVCALVSGAPNTGEVTVTVASGGTVTINITSGTLAWYGGDLTVETEDLGRNDDDGGLRGGTRETFTVTGRVTGGSTTLEVYGVTIGEAETY